MSLSVSVRQDLLVTLAALSDRKLSDEQFTALRELVKTNDEARQIYVEHLVLDALLHWSIDKAGTESDGVETEKILAELANQAGQLATERTAGRRTATAHPRVLHLRPSPKWIAVAASLMLIGYFASVAGLLMFDRLRKVELVAENSEARENLFATVRSAESSKWSDSAKPVVGGEALGGRLLQVEQGFTELEFAGGARVVVEGPAEFEVRSASAGFLHHGKLTAEVNRRAVGFSIETPSARVVDLGTAFGVAVDEHGETEVHTFVGAVEVAEVRPAKRDFTQSPRRVSAGQAVRVGVTTHIESISIDNNPFATNRLRSRIAEAVPKTARQGSVENKVPFAVETSHYGAMVLAAKPIAYFPMDEVHGQDLHDVSPSALVARGGKLAEQESPLVEGRVGRALQLHGQQQGDYALVSHFSPSKTGELSGSVWVLASGRPAGASIVKNWGNDEIPSGQFHLGLKGDTGILEIEIRLANREKVSLAEASGEKFAIGSWQHVSFVCDSQTLKLYRNGKLVASAPCGQIIANPEIHVLGIGVKPAGIEARPDNANPGYWHGLIDELAIFDRALTEEQIRKLALIEQVEP